MTRSFQVRVILHQDEQEVSGEQEVEPGQMLCSLSSSRRIIQPQQLHLFWFMLLTLWLAPLSLCCRRHSHWTTPDPPPLQSLLRQHTPHLSFTMLPDRVKGATGMINETLTRSLPRNRRLRPLLWCHCQRCPALFVFNANNNNNNLSSDSLIDFLFGC